MHCARRRCPADAQEQYQRPAAGSCTVPHPQLNTSYLCTVCTVYMYVGIYVHPYVHTYVHTYIHREFLVRQVRISPQGIGDDAALPTTVCFEGRACTALKMDPVRGFNKDGHCPLARDARGIPDNLAVVSVARLVAAIVKCQKYLVDRPEREGRTACSLTTGTLWVFWIAACSCQ